MHAHARQKADGHMSRSRQLPQPKSCAVTCLHTVYCRSAPAPILLACKCPSFLFIACRIRSPAAWRQSFKKYHSQRKCWQPPRYARTVFCEYKGDFVTNAGARALFAVGGALQPCD
eukprot:6189943-Pleurochrysis_carterae.AAC.4